MRLYHFTSPEGADSIRDRGILPTFIRIPDVGPSTMPVVSLTGERDPSPMLYKSLWDGSELSGDVREQFLRDNPGANVPNGPDTMARRVVLDVPDDDPNLYGMYFPDLQSLGFTDQSHIDLFVELGGGTREGWAVYLGAVPATFIANIEDV